MKVTPRTVFLSASLSKPVTAVAALRLVEQGVLRLDENVNARLGSWKVPDGPYTVTQKVTARRLITHRSGLDVPGRVFSGYAPGMRRPTVEQLLRGGRPSKDSAVRVNFEPGSQTHYSNAGYLALQQLMTDVTGEAFPDLLGRLVLAPAGMRESSFRQPMPTALFRRRAVGYAASGQAKAYHVYPFMAAAGLWTTPSDLGRFMMAILNDRPGSAPTLLSARTLEQVLSRTDERLGFSKLFHGKDLLFRHTGANDGFHCYLVGSVARKQALVVMTNSDTGFDIVQAIQGAVAAEYGWEYFRPAVYTERQVPAASLARFVGRYEGGGKGFEFRARDGGLAVRSTAGGNGFERATPVGDAEFVITTTPTRFTFVAAGGGAVDRLQITDWKADTQVADRVRP